MNECKTERGRDEEERGEEMSGRGRIKRKKINRDGKEAGIYGL